MAYDMLTVRRRRLNVVDLEAITTYSGSLFHQVITGTGKEFARTYMYVHGNGMVSGSSFAGPGRKQDNCLRERAGVGLEN